MGQSIQTSILQWKTLSSIMWGVRKILSLHDDTLGPEYTNSALFIYYSYWRCTICNEQSLFCYRKHFASKLKRFSYVLLTSVLSSYNDLSFASSSSSFSSFLSPSKLFLLSNLLRWKKRNHMEYQCVQVCDQKLSKYTLTRICSFGGKTLSMN